MGGSVEWVGWFELVGEFAGWMHDNARLKSGATVAMGTTMAAMQDERLP